MALNREVERKFRVHPDRLPKLPEGARLVQGYLGFEPTVRVRTEEGPGDTRKAYLTIKSPGLLSRDEYEYDLPFAEAQQLLTLARASLVSKTRHRLPVEGAEGLKWEIDFFDGDNAGLVVAEVELPDEETDFPRPDWLGEDVTEDGAYKNAALATRPFRRW